MSRCSREVYEQRRKDIEALYKEGHRAIDIARILNLHKSYVTNVINGKFGSSVEIRKGKYHYDTASNLQYRCDGKY